MRQIKYGTTYAPLSLATMDQNGAAVNPTSAQARVYLVSQTDGTLTEVSGSPFSMAQVNGLTGAYSVSIDIGDWAKGQYLVVKEAVISGATVRTFEDISIEDFEVTLTPALSARCTSYTAGSRVEVRVGDTHALAFVVSDSEGYDDLTGATVTVYLLRHKRRTDEDSDFSITGVVTNPTSGTFTAQLTSAMTLYPWSGYYRIKVGKQSGVYHYPDGVFEVVLGGR